MSLLLLFRGIRDLQVSVLSSHTVQANVAETQRLGSEVLSSFTLRALVEPDVVSGFGTVRSTATFRTQVDHSVYLSNNSSSPDLHKVLDVTTARQALGVASFGNAKRVSVLPSSTNATPLMLACGRTAAGVRLSSQGMSDLSISEASGSEMYLYTTSGVSYGVRVDIR